eukprot:TRINITY_DN8933_c0_g1_i1.p1 TRINITY_DN8933_c0_g1~~TRINITY_DN8933_c0_g1_i1.p1  ORF type:complete len:166 (+),score=19.44 TRINITY_DN8933_c0_g1_i1:37-534(+)
MILSFVLLCCLLTSVTSIPIYATWYCSLSDPTQYGYCGNPSAGWVADCGISVQQPPCSGCGITALNPAFYNQNSSSHDCHWKGVGCGECWEITGPGGTAKVMVTDCCAGYKGACSCLNCPTDPGCDWCASGDNWHFDLDISTFNFVCQSTTAGHCQLSSANSVSC